MRDGSDPEMPMTYRRRDGGGSEGLALTIDDDRDGRTIEPIQAGDTIIAVEGRNGMTCAAADRIDDVNIEPMRVGYGDCGSEFHTVGTGGDVKYASAGSAGGRSRSR